MSSGSRSQSNKRIRKELDPILETINSDLGIDTIVSEIQKKNKCLAITPLRIACLIRERDDFTVKRGIVRRIAPVMAAIAICLILISPVMAYSISSLSIEPNKDLLSGEQVIISLTLKFVPDRFGYTFPQNDTLILLTSFDNPLWSITTILDGFHSQERQVIGNSVNINGWELAYPHDTTLTLNITMDATAPYPEQTARFSILKILQSSGQITNYERTVINRQDLTASLHIVQKDLETFGEHIDEKRRMKLDVTAAQEHFNDITLNIGLIKALPESDYMIAVERLAAVKTSIKYGEQLLDQTWAQSEIDKALVPMKKTDQVVNWFQFNASLKNYPGLSGILSSRDLARQNMTSANEAMNAMDYDTARADARISFEIANRTYYNALVLQERARDPWIQVKENLHYIFIAVLMVCASLLFRKKKKKGKGKTKDVGNRTEGTSPEVSTKRIVESPGGSAVCESELQQGDERSSG